jgi:hypothetical protein
MVMKKQSYQPPSHNEYQEMIKEKKLHFIKKTMKNTTSQLPNYQLHRGS